MLQKLKVTSYVFIYFLMFGFSFIALQVTTEEVEAAGVCEPIAGIRNLEGTARHSDYTLWAERCQISGQNGNCGVAGTHWPQGDSGRCETTTAEAGAAHDNIGVCEPIAGIRNLKGTPRDKDYKLWVSRCQISGQNGNCGVAGTHWPQGDSGRCETTTAEAGAAHDNIGVCEPIAGIRNLEGTARHSDYTLWAERCLISGHNGNCGDAGTRWPQGDSGRCEMTNADEYEKRRRIAKCVTHELTLGYYATQQNLNTLCTNWSECGSTSKDHMDQCKQKDDSCFIKDYGIPADLRQPNERKKRQRICEAY